MLVQTLVLLASLTAEPTATPDFPTLSTNVLKAIAPTEAYTVNVNQAFTKPDTAPITTQFKYQWTFEKGLSRMTEPPAKGQPPVTEGPSVQIKIDMAQFIREMQKWPFTEVTTDTIDKHTAFKVTANNGSGTSVNLWIDTKNCYIFKSIMSMSGKKYAEINITAQKVKNYWLPAKATIEQTEDPSTITQEFKNYTFKKK